MAQNLSVPLAFVALLHLANEKVSFALEKTAILNEHYGWVCIRPNRRGK